MNKFFEQWNNITQVKRYGILKGYKHGIYGQPTILLNKEINKRYTLEDFQTDRLNLIEIYKDRFMDFITELR